MAALRYGLIAALIAIAVYAAIRYFEIDLGLVFDSIVGFLAELGTI